MNERQRTQYLETMGIQTFVPRWVFPAAAAPRQAPLPYAPVQPNQAAEPPAAPVAAQAPPGAEPKSRAPRAAGGMVSGIVDELQERGKRSPGASEQPSSPAKRVLAALDDAEPEPPVHFALSLWRVSPSLLVIDAHQSKQALPTGTLLNNMLFAKGLRASLSRPEVLTWPMVGATSGGWPEAREMVHAFLLARLEQQPVGSLWLMGEASYRAVNADENYQQCIGQLRDLTSFGCVATVLPSLADMLRNPALKVPAWQAIKAQKID